MIEKVAGTSFPAVYQYGMSFVTVIAGVSVSFIVLVYCKMFL